ncbi:sensor histidine kinase [Streptomyces chisholmiae]|uniref:sensor histidine kinase n=1 Tax=Streptomyces chisholmiae TaxID=3075540 RepID=UPI00288C2466|nr:histidine kinase [Streptomyces sp. DSM 44915]
MQALPPPSHGRPAAPPALAPAAGARRPGPTPAASEPPGDVSALDSPLVRLLQERPLLTRVLVATVPGALCALAALLFLADSAGWPRALLIALLDWLGCVPVVAVRQNRWRLACALLLLAASVPFLNLGELAYVGVPLTVAAILGHAVHRYRAALTAARALAGEERRRAARERQRLQRDLHDLIGYSLSAIVVQAELIDRRLAEQRAPSRGDVAELISLSRRALAEVRSLSTVPPHLSLPVELASVRRVLRTAGVETDVVDDLPALGDGRVEAAMAAVLREGTTNILRHSQARACRITVGQVNRSTVLLLSNDGYEPPRGEETGSGLEGLAVRVAAVGGQLTWSHRKGWFRLRAAFPAVLTDPADGSATASRRARRSGWRPAGSWRAAWRPRR